MVPSDLTVEVEYFFRHAEWFRVPPLLVLQGLWLLRDYNSLLSHSGGSPCIANSCKQKQRLFVWFCICLKKNRAKIGKRLASRMIPVMMTFACAVFKASAICMATSSTSSVLKRRRATNCLRVYTFPNALRTLSGVIGKSVIHLPVAL
jgi:hypothetical protein